jgi:predicted secreted protein
MAATTVFAGKDGSVVIPGTPNVAIAKLTDWSLAINADNLETTALGDQWKTFIQGIKDWQGKVSGFMVADEDQAGQQSVMNALLTGNGDLVLQLQLGQGRGYFEGTTKVTQFNVGNSVKNPQSMDASFVGNGVLNHLP